MKINPRDDMTVCKLSWIMEGKNDLIDSLKTLGVFDGYFQFFLELVVTAIRRQIYSIETGKERHRVNRGIKQTVANIYVHNEGTCTCILDWCS